MQPEEKEKIKRLVRELSQCVNAALSDNQDVKGALRDIEDEGYQVDLLFALFTRILRKRSAPFTLDEPLPPGTSFDTHFLKTLRLNWSAD